METQYNTLKTKIMEMFQKEKIVIKQPYSCKTLSFLKPSTLLNKMCALAFNCTFSRICDGLYSYRECVDLENKQKTKKPILVIYTAVVLHFQPHLCAVTFASLSALL